MDEGLRYIDVLIVLLDYLSWYDYSVYQLKLLVIQWSIDMLYYQPITSWQ